ncbi:energy transducer TonB [Sorangium cellulosum]|uniref:Energy transducer TonB n=1 Tax=Sorangium cellulosum TaxID=56 RepID=A0A150QDC5_SORCE|nr:energy transducer TonB [Sorangium cellulosum]KYF65975.1 energy transducer TonB [Sorangium cellulosum]
MHLETWNAGEADPERAKRLAIGYAAGLLLFAGIALSAARLSGAIRPPPPEEDVVDVKLAARIPEAPPVAAAPPPPPPAAEAPAPRAAAPRRAALVAPSAVPKEAPPEADPSEATPSDDDTYGEPGGAPGGVPGGIPGGMGTAGVAAPPPPPAPPPPAPQPRGPIHLPENATPPVALSCAPPVPPEAALSAGVEATVAVRFVVTETGEVTNVTIVRGHPLFNDAVLAAMKACRYKPAISDGRPVSVWRTVPFRFKAKR